MCQNHMLSPLTLPALLVVGEFYLCSVGISAAPIRISRNGRVDQRNLRKHKTGPGNGFDGQLRNSGRLLPGGGAADPSPAGHHHGHDSQGKVAAGAHHFPHFLTWLCNKTLSMYV